MAERLQETNRCKLNQKKDIYIYIEREKERELERETLSHDQKIRKNKIWTKVNMDQSLTKREREGASLILKY